MILEQTPHWFVQLFSTPGWNEAVAEFYQRQLSHFDFPYESLFLSTDFGTTHVLAAGAAHLPPIVLLHGRSVNATIWCDYLRELSQHYRVYAPDILGEGGKSDPTHPFTWSEGYAEWLEQVLDLLAVDHAALVGMSFGGWVAVKLALHAPERVHALSLLAPAGFIWAGWGFVVRGMKAGMLPRMEHTRELVEYLSPTKIQITDADCELLHMVFAHHQANAEPPPPFSDGQLRGLHIPTQVLVGSHDRVFAPTALMKRVERLLPELNDHGILRGIGHGILSDRPTIVRERVTAFLNQH